MLGNGDVKSASMDQLKMGDECQFSSLLLDCMMDFEHRSCDGCRLSLQLELTPANETPCRVADVMTSWTVVSLLMLLRQLLRTACSRWEWYSVVQFP